MSATPRAPAPSALDPRLVVLFRSWSPTVISDRAKQRTRLRVLERVQARRRTFPRALVAAGLLIAASAAAAGLQGIAVGDGVDLDVRPPRVVQGRPAPDEQRAPAKSHEPSSDSPAPDEPDTASTSSLARAATKRTATRVEPAPRRRAPEPQGRQRVVPGEDPTSVAQALRALRKEGRPEQARTLLRQYLADNPEGSLAEEALALSIEASAQHDPARAAAHARGYLKRFPQGRYRAVAERALETAR